ncbi:MAG: outer membrane protein assembly factor BamD [Xanthomonadales bacterium]|nr:outer membrane protein assembly factor BamD [Xanthomonadales bacterium]
MRVAKQSMHPSCAAKYLLIVALAALVGGCSIFGAKQRDDNLPVDALYNKAHAALVEGRYGTAATSYQRLIARFPSGNYNEHAQLELAYAQYKDNKPDDALSTINRFIKTYPANQHVDYAYYLRGLIDFDRDSGGILTTLRGGESGTARRDPAPFLQSFDDFSELSRRFPNSAYAADARQRMIYLRNMLAQYEINIAEFYLHQRAYIAAADRAQYVIEHYQQAPQVADALALLTRCYLALKQDKLAEQSRKVLALNYPDHPYLSDPKWPRAPSTLRKLIPFSGHQ